MDDIEIEIPERDSLKRMVLARLVEDASVTDSLCSFLRAVGLTDIERFSLERDLLNETTYLYEWQRFHIVSLLLDQNHSSPRFNEAAEASLANESETPTIPRDLALIVLSRHESTGWRKRIAEQYSLICKNHIEQRAGLIAVHELNYPDIVEPNVSRHVPIALRGVYRGARSTSPGCYFAPRPRLSSSSLIDVVSAYV